MGALITHAGGVIAPTAVDGYESTTEPGNIVHPILGRSDPDATLRPGMLRTGTLTLGFESPTSEADSAAAESAHRTGGVFALVADDRATIAMAYIVAGPVTRTLEPETREAWLLAVAFQEVPS